MPRPDGRAPNELRNITFQRGFTRAPGSVLASFGQTRVLCTALAQDGVPTFLQGKSRGWLTAEYAMLPASTEQRKQRDRIGSTDGRSVEIQRLIGRSLRTVVDLALLGERTIWIDCDVIQADGGTRTCAISGAWVALHDVLTHLESKRQLRGWPLRTQLAGVSVGVFQNAPVCDLTYAEDSKAETDMNIVMTGDGRFVEVQGSAEGAPFSKAELDALLDLGTQGCRRIFDLQRAALDLKA